MVKYTYVLLACLLIACIAAFVFLTNFEAPLIERAGLPRCDNAVVIDSDLRYNIINYANQRIIQGTGQSYFNNHFIYKALDYSEVDCIFTVRYEYTYNELHSDMSISIKAFSQDKFDIINTNTFLRPVGILVSEKEALEAVKAQNVEYSYYNLEIDVEQQTFEYKFYEGTINKGSRLVMIIDAQSKEINVFKETNNIIPIV